MNFLKKCLDEKVAPRTMYPRNLKFSISNPFPDILKEILKYKISAINKEINYWFSKAYRQFNIIKNKIPKNSKRGMKEKMKNNLTYRKNKEVNKKIIILERKFSLIFQNSSWAKTTTNNI